MGGGNIDFEELYEGFIEELLELIGGLTDELSELISGNQCRKFLSRILQREINFVERRFKQMVLWKR